MPSFEIRCAACGRSLLGRSDEDDLLLLVPCPGCGSTTAAVGAQSDENGAVVKWTLQIRHGAHGEASPYLEASQKIDLYQATGEHRQVGRVIDRDSDLYFEKIMDADTGQVVREVSEPLSKHRGRGDAKRKRNG